MSMLNIHKKIVSDESQQPIAVLIDYQDWLEIEKIININNELKNKSLADSFQEIRQICQEENYFLEIPKRWNRDNAFDISDK